MTTYSGHARGFHGFHITLHPVILLVGAVIAAAAAVGTRSAVMLITFLPAIFILDILVDVLGIRALITLDPDQPNDQEAVIKDIGIDIPYVLLTSIVTALLFVFVVLPQYRVAAQEPTGIVTPPTVVPSIVPSLVPATVTTTETATPTATATQTAVPTATATATMTPVIDPLAQCQPFSPMHVPEVISGELARIVAAGGTGTIQPVPPSTSSVLYFAIHDETGQGTYDYNVCVTADGKLLRWGESLPPWGQ